MELKVNTVFTRRSRVAGRARTIGNRVTQKWVREFESLLLRHNVETKKMSPAKAPIVSGFFVVQPEISTPAALPFDHAFPLPVFHPAEAALTGQAKKPRC